MHEPIVSAATPPSLAAIFVVLFGPLIGPYAAIVFGAIAGSLWPLSAAKTITRRAGAVLVLRCTTLAIVLTVSVSRYLADAYNVEPSDLLGIVALAIGAMGNGWRPVFDILSEGVAALAARVFKRPSGAEK